MKKQRSNILTAERRTSRRYPLQLEVNLRAHGYDSVAAASGFTRDISTLGFYLTGLPESIEEGSQVELAIRLPAPEDGCRSEVRGVGRVVRVDSNSEGTVGVAVKFDRVDLSPEELETIT